MEDRRDVSYHTNSRGPDESALLRAHYAAPDHTATWSQLASAVGYANFTAVNLQYGKLATRVAAQLRIGKPPRGFWLYVLARWAAEPDPDSGHQGSIDDRRVRRPLRQRRGRLRHRHPADEALRVARSPGGGGGVQQRSVHQHPGLPVPPPRGRVGLPRPPTDRVVGRGVPLRPGSVGLAR